MKISMLMPTLNRRELMYAAVKSILAQTYKDFEIIIVDQSDCSNETISDLDQRIKYYHIDEKGLSHARNVGLSYVTGDIVGLMDDDAYYTEHVLESIAKKFQNSDIGFVSGVVMDPIDDKITLPGMDNRPKEINSLNILKCCISPSMFLRANLVKKLGFDEDLGIGCFWGSAEETDIALQYLYNDMKGYFEPSIIVRHKGDDPKTISMDKLRSYSRGFGAVCCKHSHMYRNRKMLYLFFRALFRAAGGLVLGIMKADKQMIHYYIVSLVSKLEGYKSYKTQRIINVEKYS